MDLKAGDKLVLDTKDNKGNKQILTITRVIKDIRDNDRVIIQFEISSSNITSEMAYSDFEKKYMH